MEETYVGHIKASYRSQTHSEGENSSPVSSVVGLRCKEKWRRRGYMFRALRPSPTNTEFWLLVFLFSLALKALVVLLFDLGFVVELGRVLRHNQSRILMS